MNASLEMLFPDHVHNEDNVVTALNHQDIHQCVEAAMGARVGARVKHMQYRHVLRF